MSRFSARESSAGSLQNHVERMREILTEPPNRGMPTEPSQLLGHVYIGSQSHAESLKLLRKYGITHVLNCAGYKGPRPVPNASPYEGLGIDYKEFQADDEDTYDITQHFDEAFRYLDMIKKKHGTALVHCALGINRSAAVCTAYIMIHDDITILQAVKVIKKKRKVALTNKGFQLQLLKYARACGYLDRHVETESMRIDRKQKEEEEFWQMKRRRQRIADDTIDFGETEPTYRWEHDDCIPSSRVAVETAASTSGLYTDEPREAFGFTEPRLLESTTQQMFDTTGSDRYRNRRSEDDHERDHLSSMFNKVLNPGSRRQYRDTDAMDTKYDKYYY